MSIQNLQQHTVPLEIVDRLLKENQQRAAMLEELLKSQLELLKNVIGKKG